MMQFLVTIRSNTNVHYQRYLLTVQHGAAVCEPVSVDHISRAPQQTHSTLLRDSSSQEGTSGVVAQQKEVPRCAHRHIIPLTVYPTVTARAVQVHVRYIEEVLAVTASV